MIDAVLLVGFGGPTAMDEVRPFLANVLRGRPVPPDRIEAVVHHYELLGGRSPFNEITFRQARGLEEELRRREHPLPVYVGMRNWEPYLANSLGRMSADGRRGAIAVIMAAQQNDAGWYRYRREVEQACAELGGAAPRVVFAAEWHAHPLFVAAVAAQLRESLADLPPERRAAAPLVFTAHSIPVAMAESSPYVEQIREAAALVAAEVQAPRWSVAYQSRSGSPREPWLEPDICDVVRRVAADGARDLVVVPIGFVCDHVEVLYDLDIEARQVAEGVGVRLVRAATVNDHPLFLQMLADVVLRAAAEAAA